ncbi:MAG: protein kinase [Actinomycetes bacterium]
MADELIGRTLGRYEITALIGRGGMATVYRSTHPGLRQTVAVKVLRADLADDPSLLVRFEREAQAVAALRHPNIVRVIDFDHIDEHYFMVMEFVEGATLAARLGEIAAEGRRLPAAEVLRLFEPLCAAVDYAHRQGMIHRDIKPANVLLTAQGEPVLTDYGIARIIGMTQHTATGTVMGSAHYMSPEQAQGLAADGRSDLYALGVMLFEALAGRVPYEADSLPGVLFKHVTAAVPAVCPLNPALRPPIDDLMRTALAKDPGERFQTGQALAAALREELGPLVAESEAAHAPATAPPPLGPTRVEAPLPAAPPPAGSVVTPRRPASDKAPAKQAEPLAQAPQPAPATEQPVPAPVLAAAPHGHDSPLPAVGGPAAPRSRGSRRALWLVAAAVLAVVAVAGTLWVVLNGGAFGGGGGASASPSASGQSSVATVAKLKPASAKRGATVTIIGTGFGAARGASSVKFGAKTCTTYTSWRATQIKCKVPTKAKYGAVTVTVTTAAGKSKAMGFTVTIAVGDPYQGGIVAYILQRGDPGYVAGETHGLIAAAEDQVTIPGIRWWNGRDVVTGATATALGTGRANTDLICKTQGRVATSYAAGVARAYTSHGYADWYLPSKDELDKLYLNRAAIGGFGSVAYWSSSEYDALIAWHQYFDNGAQYNYYKRLSHRVRAVRAF